MLVADLLRSTEMWDENLFYLQRLQRPDLRHSGKMPQMPRLRHGDGGITKSCFSQWWMEDFYSVARSYLCMEQYMMAGKAELFGDQETMEQILNCNNPKEIKALGRKVRGFAQGVWDKFKYAIVLNGNWCKFSQNRRAAGVSPRVELCGES